MKCLFNFLPLQNHVVNCYHASCALNPNGKQPMVVRLGVASPQRSNLTQLFIMNHLQLQQLPSVYVMLVMFSSCRARELAVLPKKPSGKREWMPADCTQGCWAPPLCCVSHREASADQCRVTSQIRSCWDMTWFPCIFNTQKGAMGRIPHTGSRQRHRQKIQEYLKDFPLGLRCISLITSH